MGKIFFVMGKSASGKDTIYNRLLKDDKLGLRSIVLYTTRPMRSGETDGETYHFVDEECLASYEKENRVIELRAYNTVYGVWKYCTVDDGKIDAENNYLVIGTPESYEGFLKYFGNDRIVPIYIEVEDGVRLKRAIDRESLQAKPGYEEVCRRFLADAKDFSEDKILNLNISKRYNNEDIDVCYDEIRNDILKEI